MALTDLEICKHIAEIEGTEVFMYQHIIYGNVLCKKMTVGGIAPQPYNPLTDDALCFQLMIKYQIDVNHATFTDGTLHRYQAVNTITAKGFGLSKNLNKAICLAIIEAHNE